jgi:hypothetical protein
MKIPGQLQQPNCQSIQVNGNWVISGFNERQEFARYPNGLLKKGTDPLRRTAFFCLGAVSKGSGPFFNKPTNHLKK